MLIKRELLLTPQEVAEVLGISDDSVYRLIRKGKLAAIQIGRSKRIKQSDLDNYERNALDSEPRDTP